MTDAIRSLFGATGGREQTVFTPSSILDVVRYLWNDRIAYDPCHGPPGKVLTKQGRLLKRQGKLIHVPECNWVEQGLAVSVRSLVGAERITETNGLSDPWVPESYVNPPYKDLKMWLQKSDEEHVDHVMLVPVRTHRKWWRRWAADSELVYLNPLKFHGHDNCFPAALCLARKHGPPDEWGQMTELCVARGLGEPPARFIPGRVDCHQL